MKTNKIILMMMLIVMTLPVMNASISINSLTMSVYNGSCDEITPNVDIPLITDTLDSAELAMTQYRAQLTFNVNGTPYMGEQSNTKYCALYNYTTIDENGDTANYQMTDTVIYDKYIQRPGQFESEWTFPWIIVLLLFIIALGLNARTASKGSIVILVILGLVYRIGWMSNGSINQQTLGIAITLCLILVIFWNIKREM